MRMLTYLVMISGFSSNVGHVHVLPTELDVPRFEEALSKVLQLYPHAAGQLRCNGGCWSIELTNTAVPVDIDYKLDTSSDSLLNGDWVVQDDISPFLSSQPSGANHVDADAPLLRLKLTFFDNETSIGVSWHHTLGDATVLSRFTHTLSQFYQDLPQEYATPTFRKYHFPTPSHFMSAEFWPRMPHYHRTCHFSELGKIATEWCGNMEYLRWRFDNHDLAELRSILSSRGPNERSLSKQDCLTAYLVSILNHNRSIPVRKVTHVSSYRDISAPFVMKDVAGNLVRNVPATVPMDVAGIAVALRRAFIQCSKPDYIYNWISVASNHMLETANAGKTLLLFVLDDAMVTVHSTTAFDWCSAHFGCPDGSRFYTTGTPGKLCLRYVRSNPVKGDDGVWQARHSVDILLGVAAGLKSRVLETLTRGIQHNLSEGRTRL